jgi:hypothetical protein
VVSLLVEISHSDLSKVTRMVFIHIRSVMMLTTSKTSTTGMLAVLAYTTVSGGDMAATVRRLSVNYYSSLGPVSLSRTTSMAEIALLSNGRLRETYCLRVFDKWVGIAMGC